MEAGTKSINRQNRNRNTEQTNRGKYITGLILTFVQIVFSVVVFYLLWQSNMIPSRYLVLILVALIVLIIVFRLLMGRAKHNIRFWVGAILSIICSVALVVVTAFVPQVTGTVASITDTRVETSNVGVYVLEEDPAQSVRDVAQDPFGILATLTREDTDQAVELIEENTDSTLDLEEYDDVVDMADALLDGTCRSIILSDGFVDVVTDVEGYEEFDSQIRLLDNYTWETVLPVTVTEDGVQTTTLADGTVITTQPDGTVSTTKPDGTVSTEKLAGNTQSAGEEDALSSTAEVEGLITPTAQEVLDEGCFVMYISGIDTSGATSSKGRSDVNILAVVNTNTRQILLVSTPRDYFVPLSISNGVNDKLTHAGLYGIQTSIDTMEMIYGIPIDYYFRLNFSGFEELIDALGGVDVYSAYTFDVEPSFHYVQGVNHLSGIEALAFVRERYSFSAGDRQRGENQMALLTGVLNALQSSAILNDVPALMSSLSSCFDSNMPYDLLTSLVKDQLRYNTPWNISTYSVDGSGSNSTTYTVNKSTYVMIPDESTVAYAKELMHAVLSGETVN